MSCFAQWGYIIRYLVGQTPQLVVKGLQSSKLNIFHVGELWVQNSENAESLSFSMKTLILPLLNHLKNHGVEVVLLPVPTKTSIYRKQLSTPLPETELWSKAGAITTSANEFGPDRLMSSLRSQFAENMVDLLGAYRRHLASEPKAELYTPLEYHWSSTGIAVAVSELVKHLRKKGWRFSDPRLVSAGKQMAAPSYLLGQFLLPEWFVRSRPEFQSEEALFHVAAESRDERPNRIVIAGTSFNSSNALFSFSNEVSTILNRNVENFAHNNGGMHGSFEEMHKRSFVFHKGDLLIWELPICCLNMKDQPIQLPTVDEKNTNQ